ncbi:MAG: Gfo/Idh/MocA family oxidoreductase [Leptospiraceae bacterium]|nr:Gfo/Idh/MocA family oxidoreductase [Leptospiraceae bacterium]
MKTLILGLGRIASILEKDKKRYHPCTHAGVIFNSPLKNFFHVRGVFDPNPNRVLDFLKDWKLEKMNVLTNMESLKREEFDFAVIASSSNAHFENLLFCLEKKIPYILVEKPIVQNLEEFKQIAKLARKVKSTIWVNHERRYHPIYQFVKDVVRQKTYGELKTIKASVLTSMKDPGLGFNKLGGGPLLHDGTHAIDFLDFLFEEIPEIIQSKIFYFQKSKLEKRVLATLRYKKDQFVFLEVGGERDYFQFEIDVQTTQARFILSNDGHKFFISKTSPLYSGFRSLKEIQFPKHLFQKNPWIELYKEIINYSRGLTRIQLGNIEANFRILKTIQKIYNHKK